MGWRTGKGTPMQGRTLLPIRRGLVEAFAAAPVAPSPTAAPKTMTKRQHRSKLTDAPLSVHEQRALVAGYVKWLESHGHREGVIAFWLGLERPLVRRICNLSVFRGAPEVEPPREAYKVVPPWL